MVRMQAWAIRGLALLWLASAAAGATESDWAARIQARNADWARAAESGDMDALRQRYADDATLMPEHARVRRGRQAVDEFLRQWWTLARPARWQRQIDFIDDAGAHVIEVGRYAQRLQRQGQPHYEYSGKYLAVWRKSDDGGRVVAELWGADAPFERSRLPEMPDASVPVPALNHSGAAIQQALADRNALIATLVRERRGAEHAALFRDDAAYLTYYTPTLRGIAAIRTYFIEHERPGPVSIDSLDLRSDGLRALDGGDVQLEEGAYRVGWRAGGDSGVVAGKSLNIWKREADGSWRMFRQAVNHD